MPRTKKQPKPKKYKTFNPRIAENICMQILGGKALTHIITQPGMPCRATVYNWLKMSPRFAELYRVCVTERFNILTEEVISKADQATPDTVAVTRLQMQARMWVANRYLRSLPRTRPLLPSYLNPPNFNLSD